MAKLVRGSNDLQTYCISNNRTDLLEEWDYVKNKGLTPSDVCYGANKKMWWNGKCGHSYSASLNRRTANKTACPYCCNSHAKVLSGFNDLATTNPDLLASWDYEKNGELLPTMVLKGQHIQVWWKGACGHSWKSSIYHRVGGRGCPICMRERKTSFPEQAIFFYIQQHFSDAENSNTSILKGKELDIYLPSKKVGIEFDGSKWHTDKSKDEIKNRLCESAGVHLFRIRDTQCPTLSPNPFVHIIDFPSYTDESLLRAIKLLGDYLGVSFTVSLERDRAEILSRFIAQRKENSIKDPVLLSEWNYERNGDLLPDMVTPMSSKKVWWKCEKGHEWESVISSRTQGAGCPFCNSNRLLKGFNDLETREPQLLKYWCYEKNSLHPYEVTATSYKKVWWHCHDCGSDFLSPIRNKVKFPNSCPYCSHRLPLVGKTDLKTINPNLAAEWDYENNNGLLPDDVTPFSDRVVWWKCRLGHSYQSSPANRTAGRGCPYCSGHKVLPGFNDFASLHPDLVHEWNYEKNSISPSDITEHSGKTVWWQCDIGHEWKTTVDSRSNGHGCPYCSGNNKRAVRNLDTNMIYSSLSKAASACGLRSGDTISLCCIGKLKTAGGYHWEYVTNSIKKLNSEE